MFYYKNGKVTQAVEVHGYDEQDDMLKVKSTQKKFRSDFTGDQLDPKKWVLVQKGDNQTVTVTNGLLTIDGGTVQNEETIIRSLETFTIPVKTTFAFYASQFLAAPSYECYVEMVSVDADGNPDGLSSAAWLFSGLGANASDAVYQVQAGGLPRLNSVLTNTSLAWGTPGTFLLGEIELFSDESWFHNRTMDSPSGRSYSYVRHQQIPNPNAQYKVQIRVLNTGTPATTTSFNFQYVAVQDYAELTTEITASRGAAAAGMALPVQVANSPKIAGVTPADARTTSAVTATTGDLPTVPFLFNEVTYDRQRPGNTLLTALTSAARTATTSTTTLVNHNGRGGHITLNITALTAGASLTIDVFGKPIIGANYKLIPTSTAITATGTYTIEIYPYDTANPVNGLFARHNQRLARQIVVTINAANTSSVTYSLDVSFMD